MRRPNWSPAEDAILRAHYAAGTAPASCLAALPMRTYDSCVQRASLIGLTKKRTRLPKADAKETVAPKNITPLPYRQQLAREVLLQHERDRIAATVVKPILRQGKKRAYATRKMGKFA